jgi:hypothetical protein
MVSDLLAEMDEGKQTFPEQAVKEIALTVFVGECARFLLRYRKSQHNTLI